MNRLSLVVGLIGDGQWCDAVAGECLCESDAVPGGLTDVGVVQEPVDGRSGQRLWHQLVKR